MSLFQKFTKRNRNNEKKDNKDKTKEIEMIKKELEKEKELTKELLSQLESMNSGISHKPNIPLRLRETNTNYVYLVQEREFIRMHEDVYKVGKSIQKNCQRVDDYPKFSDIILIIEVDHCRKVENAIIKEFKKKFETTEYGRNILLGINWR